MKTFTLYYLLLLPLLFGIFYWDLSPVAVLINTYQSKITLYTLSMGLPEGQLQGVDIMINPHYKVVVTKACNGMIPILVLYAAILAYPVRWSHKVYWLLVGYVVLTTINIARLYMVATLVKAQSDFPLYHDLFGNLLLMAIGLLLFYLFLATSQRTAKGRL